MNNRLVKNYLIFFTGTGLSAIAGLASSIIYNWTFSPDVLGRYSLVNTTYLVVYAFLCGWLASSFFRYYLEYKSAGQETNLFNVIFTMLICINAILVGLLFTLYSLIRDSDFLLMLFIFSFNILPRCLVDLFVSKFKLDNTMKGYFIITVINSFGTLGVSLVLIFAAGLGVMSLVIAPVVVNALVLLFLVLRFRSFFKFSFQKAIITDFWQYGGPLIITGLINVGLALSDRYLIRYFFTEREVGLYAYAYDLSEKFFKIFVNVFILTIQTYLMQVWHEDRNNYGLKVKTFTRYYYLAFIPLVFIVDTLLDFMFGVVLNQQYLEGRTFTLIVLAAMFFDGLISLANRGFAVHRKTVYLRNVAFGAVAINLLLNVTLMPVFGYKTAAYTTLAAYFAYVLLIYIFSIRKINWKWEFYDRVIFTTLPYWLAAYIIMRLVPSYPIKLALLVLFCLIYLLILPKDIKQLLSGYKNEALKLLKTKRS